MWVTWLISYPNCDGIRKARERGREEKWTTFPIGHIWVVKFIATMYELLYLWLRSQTWQKSVGCSTIIPSRSRLSWFIITYHLILLCERTNPFSNPSGPLEILCSDLPEGDFSSSPFLEGSLVHHHLLRLPFNWALPAPGFERSILGVKCKR